MKFVTFFKFSIFVPVRSLFYIVICCVVAHALSFTYVNKNALTDSNQNIELEDFAEESDNSSEEDIKESGGHCPFYEYTVSHPLFFSTFFQYNRPSDEFIISHILPVECLPPEVTC